ncbi:MAG: aspartate--tRNA ligase [Chloroflexi bacterium]|nr:aspartate--tRNA ligase [Chloroflexota bacterium]
MLKTIPCGDVRATHAGQSVTLAGWVHRRRDHGGLIFIDLRDSRGLVQVVFNPELAPEAHRIAQSFRGEWVVQVEGVVRLRPTGTANPNLPTGETEVYATRASVLNQAKTPPFDVTQDAAVDEALRLRYRYLDLRRPQMARNIRLRHRIVKFIRDFLDERDFVEVETPILTKSTPEGARDYLVPSRLYAGNFYALPQSPQQLKQLLMVAGFDKYFQIARCFRDEATRADRQPEFTQLDLEMAFIDREDVLQIMEDLYSGMARAIAPDKRIPGRFPRLAYDDAMERYGSDKPDLRFGLELCDFTPILQQTGFQVFRGVIASGGAVKAIAAPGMAGVSRREADDLVNIAKGFGAGGLVTLGLAKEAPSIDALTAEHVRSSAGRALSLDEVKAMAKAAQAKPGDLLLLAAGKRDLVNNVLGRLRTHLGEKLGLADPNELAFCFILDFPMLEWNDEDKKWDAVHHPFTSPLDEHWDILESNPGAVKAKAYDLACNGSEIAGGSIRIHRGDLQARMFKQLGLSPETVQAQFGHLIEAFEYGAPPHGGFAGGIERLAVLFSEGATSIRDVMAFPKTQEAQDLLFGAPSPVTPAQLKELHIKVVDAP